MPLFKRRDEKEGRTEEEKPGKGRHPAKKGEEGTEDEETLAAEEELLGDVEIEDEDDDEEEPSIDDLLEGMGSRDDGAEGMAEPRGELDETLGELAGEAVHLIKMAKKVVVIGNPAVGKTSLIKRFVQDVFDDRYLNTIGAKVMKKELGVNRPDSGEIVDLKMILWDIAGQETFNTVKKAYYRGASGAIVVCDNTRRETMEDLHRWIENLFDVSDVIPMIIIVNKIDLEGEAQFSKNEVQEEYAPYGATVFTTSAKTGENVELIFHELGKLISN
jgi:small GTP-binding protein